MTLTGGPNIVWKRANQDFVRSCALESASELLAGRFGRTAFEPGDGTKYTATIVPINNGNRYLVVLDDSHVFTWDGDTFTADEIQDRVQVRDWDAVVYGEFLTAVATVFEAKPGPTKVERLTARLESNRKARHEWIVATCDCPRRTLGGGARIEDHATDCAVRKEASR